MSDLVSLLKTRAQLDTDDFENHLCWQAAKRIEELEGRDKHFGELLAEDEHEHNRTLNRLSHRHAEQISFLKRRIEALEARALPIELIEELSRWLSCDIVEYEAADLLERIALVYERPAEVKP